MLTLCGEQVQSLWDEVLPVEVRELLEDLAQLDRSLSDGLLLSIAQVNDKTVELIKAHELHMAILGFVVAIAGAPVRESLPSRPSARPGPLEAPGKAEEPPTKAPDNAPEKAPENDPAAAPPQAARGGKITISIVKPSSPGPGAEYGAQLGTRLKVDGKVGPSALKAIVEDLNGQVWQASARERGRPSIAMATFVRLMVIKQRTGWGYETLVREVSDSLHLRRFCLIGIDRRVPDESTVRKPALARRLGPGVVEEITRMVIETAQRETRFVGRAARIDSTVVDADIRYPSDAVLALQGARALAREGKKLSAMVKGAVRVRDRSRSIGKTVRPISRTLGRRTGQAKDQVMALNQQAGRLIAHSVREATRLTVAARASARGRGARAKLRAAQKLTELADRCGRVATQIDRRARNLKITDRLVSLSDPDARPIRKGKLGKPTEFGYVAQICEVTENTRPGARGFILPAVHLPGNPTENLLLPQTADE
jgi:hypothetical protein